MRHGLNQFFSNVPRWAYRLIFFIVTFLSLHFICGDVIYRLFWNGYFATNSIYLHEVVDHTGGALRYLGQFLNQLLCYPTLGALMIAALATGVAYLIDKCWPLDELFFPLAFLPSVLLLSLYTGVGYDIYMRIDTSFGLSTLLGILAALMLFHIYKTTDRLRWGDCLVSLTTALLYPALGFYALVALLMMTLHAWYSKRHFFVSAGLLLFALFVQPFIFDVWCFDDGFNWGTTSLLLSASSMKLRTLQIVSVCSVVIFSSPLHKLSFKCPSYCKTILFALSFVLLYALSYKDKIYYSELKVSRLTDACQWEEVIRECKQHKRLSRTLNAYRVIALANTNRLSNELFKIDIPFEKTPFSPNEHILFEDVMMYHAGLLNSTTRVSIESWQRFGMSYRRLRFLTLCALLRGEDRLAARYMNQMSQSFVMSGEVSEMNLLKDDRTSYMAAHPDCAMVEQRMPTEDALFLGSATISRYFLCFGDLPRSSYELRLMSDLWERNLTAFMNDVSAYVSTTDKPIASCIKEAAAIAVLNGASQSLLGVVQMDENTWNRVNGFISAMKRHGGMNSKAKNGLKSSYGKSYCYYFFLGKEEN